MKISRKFIIGIIAFLMLMFVLQLNLPQSYSWIPTFSHKDKNPFGCYVFDSVMSGSLPAGYSVTDRTLYQISHDSALHNVLVVTNDVNMSGMDVGAVRRIAERGGSVMIVGCSKTFNHETDSLLLDNFGVSFRYGYFSIGALRYKIKSDAERARSTICWRTDDAVYGKNVYPVYSMMTENLIMADTAKNIEVLAFSSPRNEAVAETAVGDDSVAISHPTADTICEEKPVPEHPAMLPVAARCNIGRGDVILVSTPLLFTNYGILDDHTSGYIFRLMSQIADKPVVRTTACMKTPDAEEAEASPLRFFLGQPPLRTALYLTLLVIALFMIFTARRRQRIIPLAEPPQNRSLEFVKLIGTLYYQKKDHSDIVRKKFAFFAEELRRMLMVDITDMAADGRSFSVISMHTGLQREEVGRIINDIRKVADRENDATEYGLRLYIDNMNMIINKIT